MPHSFTQLLLVWKHRCNAWTGTYKQWPHSRLPKPSITISAPAPQSFFSDRPQTKPVSFLLLHTSPSPHSGTFLLCWWPFFHHIYFLPLTTKKSWIVFKVIPLTINDPLFCFVLFFYILARSSNCWRQGRITSSLHFPCLMLNSRSIPILHQHILKSSIGKTSCRHFL